MITSEGRKKKKYLFFYLSILHGLVPSLTVASCNTAEYLQQALTAATAYRDCPRQAVQVSP